MSRHEMNIIKRHFSLKMVWSFFVFRAIHVKLANFSWHTWHYLTVHQCAATVVEKHWSTYLANLPLNLTCLFSPFGHDLHERRWSTVKATSWRSPWKELSRSQNWWMGTRSTMWVDLCLVTWTICSAKFLKLLSFSQTMTLGNIVYKRISKRM